jgi:hypothetical protein
MLTNNSDLWSFNGKTLDIRPYGSLSKGYAIAPKYHCCQRTSKIPAVNCEYLLT